MVKVKICGLTRVEDVKLAADLGADLVGTITEVTVPTPRNLTIDQAREIFGAVEGPEKVAVTTPASPEEAIRIARELELDYIQIHSAMPPEQLREVKNSLPINIIGAIQVPKKTESPEEVVNRALATAEVVDYLMLDTKGPTGGETGIPHDWNLSSRIREASDKPVFLAGGLRPSNVKEAIQIVKPYGVDVASGIESVPAIKDPKLMEEFILAARS